MDTKDNSVVYMSDFLMTRRNVLVDNQIAMYKKATALSKRDDPRADPFAGHLMKKVDEFSEKIAKIDEHLDFINKKSIPVDSSKYSLNYGQPAPVPPPVAIRW